MKDDKKNQISYAVKALLLRLFNTSDELEITLEKVTNLLKTILLLYVFFGHGHISKPNCISYR